MGSKMRNGVLRGRSYLARGVLVCLLPLSLFSQNALGEALDPSGYGFVIDPGSSRVAFPFKKPVLKEDSKAILIDGKHGPNVSNHIWRNFDRSVYVVRIHFVFGDVVFLRSVKLHGLVQVAGKTKLAPSLVRVLGVLKGERGALYQIKSEYWTAGKTPLDISFQQETVTNVEIEIHIPRRVSRLTLEEVSFTGAVAKRRVANALEIYPSVTPWVDCFGQYVRENWDSKIKTSEDLKRRGVRDVSLSKKIHKKNRDSLDKYGGLLNTGSELGLKKTGYFRVEKKNGKWWFVTPLGNVFFSLGIDGMMNPGQSIDPEVLQIREGCNLRKNHFYLSNLVYKYGEDYEQDWLGVTLARINEMGFNTVGKWSNLKLVRSLNDENAMPYVKVLKLASFLRMIPRRGPGGDVPDVFDPRFDSKLAKALNSLCKDSRQDPWLLGYIVNNEQVWNWKLVGDIAALKAEKWPVKRKLISWLNEQYGSDIAGLGRIWGLKARRYEDLNSPFKMARPKSKKHKKQMEEFVGVVARRYFSSVAKALRQADPNHLYLGNSLGWMWCEEAVKAYGTSVDVASFDHYTLEFDHRFFDKMAVLTNKPLLVAEHGLSVARNGLRAYRFPLKDDQDRGMFYAKYLSELLKKDYMVGNFYFLLKDMDIAGKRGRFEKNFGLGLIDVTDEIYGEFAQTLSGIQKRLYEIRGL
jgi:hypothetical protein